MIFLANADEWGFSGSRRWVKDLFKFSCESLASEDSALSRNAYISANDTSTGFPLCLSPLYPNTLFQDIAKSPIDTVLAIDQIGILNANNFYLHHAVISSSKFPQSSDDESKMNYDIAIASAVANEMNISLSLSPILSNGAIPPSPLTSFIRASEEFQLPNAITGLLLTGYNSSFIDPRYHTRLDTSNFVSFESITK